MVVAEDCRVEGLGNFVRLRVRWCRRILYLPAVWCGDGVKELFVAMLTVI